MHFGDRWWAGLPMFPPRKTREQVVEEALLKLRQHVIDNHPDDTKLSIMQEVADALNYKG